ncbi:MAG: tRNA (N6-isopentenyl adenosine(37)-C2)-methylthiotransferase MiaB [Planctomycetota bacterium]|nr:tRNA (N6-isopentenyl adenosine(37)-C2)-methylthiotransferase MiaB [Planctomycetota bacterium]
MNGPGDKAPKVYIETFGCQMNKLDSELLMTKLLDEGFIQGSSAGEADVILFNTCSVRKHAEERVYSRLGSISRIRRGRPWVVVGVVGCMAEKDRAGIFERVPQVDVVCGVRGHDSLPGLLHRAIAARRDIGNEPSGSTRLCAAGRDPGAPAIAAVYGVSRRPECRPSPFQAYVMAMTGCACKCAYCVVPALRGAEASRPVDEVLNEIRALARQGCVEVTLLGQNITAYGRSLGLKDGLADLFRKINDIDGLRRIRFVTSHPAFMTRRLLETIADLEKICPYIHAPAQSGSDRILARMGRGYTAKDYMELLESARCIIPGVEFASDFIVGFPGEDEADFERTVDLVRQARFLNSYIFKYSARPSTRAADWPDDVPLRRKEERNTRLLKEQATVSAEKHAALVGSEMEILLEGPSRRTPHLPTGRTRFNHIVFVEPVSQAGLAMGGRGRPGGLEDCGGRHPAESARPGQIVRVRIKHVTPLALYGEPVGG